MTDDHQHIPVGLLGAAGGAGRAGQSAAGTRWASTEPVLAAAAFVLLCVAVLTVAPVLVGPDADAYRASIVGITDGHYLSLSTSAARALAFQLARCPKSAAACLTPGPRTGLGIALEQWVRLADGRWISEKNPGYPFLAAPFQALGVIRLVPLCYGALGSLGLYLGARRWLGRWGGACAVGLFCSSDAALLFAWQDYWPTFTEASLVAAGTGALLWAVLADASARRRTWAGLLGFLAIEAAVAVRYTDLVVLGCAVVAVLVLGRLRPGSLPRLALGYWLGSTVILVVGLAAFDDLVYGGPLRTGYKPGEVTFSVGALAGNLRYMPANLIAAMPMLVLGLAGLAAITGRLARFRRREGGLAPVLPDTAARRDAAVAAALGASWFCLWALYAGYAWTARPGIGTWQSARFYVPAAGAIALLGAWALVRLPRLADRLRMAGRSCQARPRLAVLAAAAPAGVIVGMFALGIWTFHGQASAATPAAPRSPHCNIGQPHCTARPPRR